MNVEGSVIEISLDVYTRCDFQPYFEGWNGDVEGQVACEAAVFGHKRQGDVRSKFHGEASAAIISTTKVDDTRGTRVQLEYEGRRWTARRAFRASSIITGIQTTIFRR